jgi:hypothetical protein
MAPVLLELKVSTCHVVCVHQMWSWVAGWQHCELWMKVPNKPLSQPPIPWASVPWSSSLQALVSSSTKRRSKKMQKKDGWKTNRDTTCGVCRSRYEPKTREMLNTGRLWTDSRNYMISRGLFLSFTTYLVPAKLLFKIVRDLTFCIIASYSHDPSRSFSFCFVLFLISIFKGLWTWVLFLGPPIYYWPSLLSVPQSPPLYIEDLEVVTCRTY